MYIRITRSLRWWQSCLAFFLLDARSCECCRFGGTVTSLQNLQRLCTDRVELDGGPGGRSQLLSITGWLLTGESMWSPPAGLWRTLRVLEVEDYRGQDWGVLGARATCISQLQVLSPAFYSDECRAVYH